MLRQTGTFSIMLPAALLFMALMLGGCHGHSWGHHHWHQTETDTLLINPSAFANENQTFSVPVYQSYGNITRDVCYIRDVALGGWNPNFADAADVYLNGRFAFAVNRTTGTLLNRTRTFYSLVSRSLSDPWFQLFSGYYKKNASLPFYTEWMNATLYGGKPFDQASKRVRQAAAQALAMVAPVYYMYHEMDEGLDSLEGGITTRAAEEVVHGFFVFYGPQGSDCSVPVLFQQAAEELCTVDKSGVSIHLKALEAAFAELVKAAPLGNSTAGLAAYEAGRQSLFKATSLSALQLMVQSAKKAVRAAKWRKLDSYRAALAEGRAYFRMVEPYVNSKSRTATRRLNSLFNSNTGKMRRTLVGQVRAAALPYLKAVKVSWRSIQGC